jgi:hypothetical protein
MAFLCLFHFKVGEMRWCSFLSATFIDSFLSLLYLSDPISDNLYAIVSP